MVSLRWPECVGECRVGSPNLSLLFAGLFTLDSMAHNLAFLHNMCALSLLEIVFLNFLCGAVSDGSDVTTARTVVNNSVLSGSISGFMTVMCKVGFHRPNGPRFVPGCGSWTHSGFLTV